VSPVSVSNHAICCQLGWKSHPIIIMRRLLSSQRLWSSNQDYRFESSLRSYPINSFAFFANEWTGHGRGYPVTRPVNTTRRKIHPSKQPPRNLFSGEQTENPRTASQIFLRPDT